MIDDKQSLELMNKGFVPLNLRNIRRFLYHEDKGTLAIVNQQGIIRTYKFSEVFP